MNPLPSQPPAQAGRYATREEWEAAHPLTYRTGQEICVGDVVDFGFDVTTLGIDPMEPWYGNVVRRDGAHVIVDTFLNRHERFEPGDLRLVDRRQWPADETS